MSLNLNMSFMQVLSKDQSLELFSGYPEDYTTICTNLMIEFGLTIEGKQIPGVEDDLSVRLRAYEYSWWKYYIQPLVSEHFQLSRNSSNYFGIFGITSTDLVLNYFKLWHGNFLLFCQDKDKMDTKVRIIDSMEQRLEQRFSSLCQVVCVLLSFWKWAMM